MRVFTSSPDGYSVNSTLVYGDKDAILIDSQFLLSEAHRLTAMILESKKNLTTVYITHPHPDHYFGLAVIKQAFPNARLVALPATVAGIKAGWGPRYKFWSATHGDNVPADPVIPEELHGNALLLEGHLYDHFHAHAPAIQLLLATIPITLIAILFLPEPAGKTLEEISGA